MSPTQRSLQLLRGEGWIAEVVERWIPGANIRRDLFGFVDILAFKNDTVLAVQTTSTGTAARIAKITAEPKAAEWRTSIYRKIEVHGWAKRGARGKRKVWTCVRTTL